MRRRTRSGARAAALLAAVLLGTAAIGPGCDGGGEPEAPGDPAALALARSDPLGRHVGERHPASLESVLERRFLRVLTSRNAFDFFIYDGRRGGYQYDMVRAFTDFLNRRHPGRVPIRFELIPVEDDALIPLLLDGAADMVAARLTITPARSERVAFSRPYRSEEERIVAHDESAPVEEAFDLSGRVVIVREESSYAASLKRLNRELLAAARAPVRVEHPREPLETERILELVAARRFAYSVADGMIAEAAAALHEHLVVVPDVSLRSGAKLAWATTPGATALLEEMNAFLKAHAQGTLLGNLTYRRYFEGEAGLAERIAESEAPTLSPFDPLFREHAEAYGYDWRLIAALAYQESRFDPHARNRWGATGLMQIKPETAREPYVGIPGIAGAENVERNVEAGVKYLAWIQDSYFAAGPELRERDSLRLALAAYNAGPHTIVRARERAGDMGLDPDRFFGHVERALLEMRETEPVSYVSEINQRYLAYLMLGVE